jgi:hypothetical protein
MEAKLPAQPDLTWIHYNIEAVLNLTVEDVVTTDTRDDMDSQYRLFGIVPADTIAAYVPDWELALWIEHQPQPSHEGGADIDPEHLEHML